MDDTAGATGASAIARGSGVLTWRRSTALLLACLALAASHGLWNSSIAALVDELLRSSIVIAAGVAAALFANMLLPRSAAYRPLWLVLAMTSGFLAVDVPWWIATRPQLEQQFSQGLIHAGLPWWLGIAYPGGAEAVVGWAALALALLHERDQRIAQELHQATLSQLELEGQRTQLHVQILQSQIEPHFLFNTLATVQRLYEVDASDARAMLHHLVHYLEASLPAMRAKTVTLDQEVGFAVAYLRLQKMRMGERLSSSISVPDDLRCCAVPPMMVMTLVENAIKHGVGPLPEGGTVRLNAMRRAGRLRIEVSDSGVGFGTALGTGTGLANVRARLRALHGSAAWLELAANSPRGAIAAIELPLGVADTGAP
jgi:signal transduction histidine kinase